MTKNKRSKRAIRVNTVPKYSERDTAIKSEILFPLSTHRETNKVHAIYQSVSLNRKTFENIRLISVHNNTKTKTF